MAEKDDDNIELTLTASVDKIYRGGYNYYNGEKIYAEESFDVIRDNKELTFTFKSEFHTRIATGELFTIKTDYTIGKDYIPRKVEITKALGRERVTELFEANNKTNLLKYSFIKRGRDQVCEVSTPPRFHIGAPCAATSFLFILSKKFDATSKNDYVSFISKNQWEYSGPIISKTFSLEKLAPASENIEIDGKSLTGDYYKFYEFDMDDGKIKKSKKEKKEKESIKIFLSKHMAMPYLVTGQSENQIKIKYLNHLDTQA
ncbi:MAG: hypothetical protein A2504_15165 [Bdellovibrionales bacterium RIFOXYD12_FULL_39_22]|nr:MAG: hypothetical protein A2385_02595 [Bdellovibrionales bacterium RIFOXYB1_FULL_39_21]OFZ43136.1 MAG: hypothetical protein A2485_11740 [Bdellovibrionales bacterium RIFOXYC12_FULL_39_17]OFZ47874.1 MAG: hypothetical protein A2404_16380 [Bdellovibrionales bacterium RIFOXYC1_FULL_39_130]OFZ75654.1 MAG: hypothetical protein A2560_12880 [Bdellovibrionales bacterium RIFOXYD1_FULL_39_84]OFZ94144.1 MAG: hypothetical protein A2504_15165 [Bdellovibrionales bacterium RIFOXYD12_FULL_39_22]HLE11791.1 hy